MTPFQRQTRSAKNRSCTLPADLINHCEMRRGPQSKRIKNIFSHPWSQTIDFNGSLRKPEPFVSDFPGFFLAWEIKNTGIQV